MLIDWLLTVAMATSLIVPITALVAGVALKRRAAARHVAWASCFVVLGLVMVLTIFSARRRAAHWNAARSSVASVAWPPDGAASSMPGVAATIALQGDLPSTAAARRWAALGDALRLVWVIGIVLLVTRVVRRTVTAWSLGRVAIRMPPGLAGKLLAAPRALLGVGRPVTLKVVPAGSARNIGTVGLWRPVIFLPQSAMAWPLDRQRRVLMHEMSHVAHGDWAVRIGVDLIVALLWFHPFVWEAARQLRLGQEDAADDVVLRADADPYTYATDLVDLAAAGRPWPHGGTSGDS